MAWLKLNRSRLAASCGLAYSVKDSRQQRVAMTRKPSGFMLSFQRSRATRPLHRATRCISSFREFWGSTEEVWQAIFASDRLTYRPPRLVLYTSATYAACGLAEKIMGPFYCPDDQKVYLDLSFFQEMQTELHACDSSGADCQLPQAYVIAHEIGHHVQNLLGIMPKMRELQGSLETEAERNRLQVLLELQADCLAGIWARKIKEKAKINASDIAAAIRTTEALGNDTLQKSAFGVRSA
ncbi:putative metalloprotease [Bradyrhizobium sp. i1.3.1]